MQKNSIIVAGILFLFLGIYIIPIAAIDNEEKSIHPLYNSDILYVGGSGLGNYTKIQDAIDNASDGDIIFVYSGNYFENIVIEKKLNIIGKNRNNTILCPKEENDIIKISSKGSETTIACFTFLSDTIRCYAGIEMYQSSDNKIENNTFIIPYSLASLSIKCSGSNNNLIKNNKVLYNGIELEESTNNIILDNDISNINNYAIELERADYNLIEDNYVVSCLSISIGESNYNTITGNYIRDNVQGVGLSISKGNKIIGNNFEKNRYGVVVFWCGINSIHKNNFIDNYKNAGVVGNWRRPFNSWKLNYWDDWIGLSNPFLFWIPKYIEGEIRFNPEKSIRCFNFDLNPVKEPYDIGV